MESRRSNSNQTTYQSAYGSQSDEESDEECDDHNKHRKINKNDNTQSRMMNFGSGHLPNESIVKRLITENPIRARNANSSNRNPPDICYEEAHLRLEECDLNLNQRSFISEDWIAVHETYNRPPNQNENDTSSDAPTIHKRSNENPMVSQPQCSKNCTPLRKSLKYHCPFHDPKRTFPTVLSTNRHIYIAPFTRVYQNENDTFVKPHEVTNNCADNCENVPRRPKRRPTGPVRNKEEETNNQPVVDGMFVYTKINNDTEPVVHTHHISSAKPNHSPIGTFMTFHPSSDPSSVHSPTIKSVTILESPLGSSTVLAVSVTESANNDTNNIPAKIDKPSQSVSKYSQVTEKSLEKLQVSSFRLSVAPDVLTSRDANESSLDAQSANRRISQSSKSSKSPSDRPLKERCRDCEACPSDVSEVKPAVNTSKTSQRSFKISGDSSSSSNRPLKESCRDCEACPSDVSEVRPAVSTSKEISKESSLGPESEFSSSKNRRTSCASESTGGTQMSDKSRFSTGSVVITQGVSEIKSEPHVTASGSKLSENCECCVCKEKQPPSLTPKNAPIKPIENKSPSKPNKNIQGPREKSKVTELKLVARYSSDAPSHTSSKPMKTTESIKSSKGTPIGSSDRSKSPRSSMETPLLSKNPPRKPLDTTVSKSQDTSKQVVSAECCERNCKVVIDPSNETPPSQSGPETSDVSYIQKSQSKSKTMLPEQSAPIASPVPIPVSIPQTNNVNYSAGILSPTSWCQGNCCKCPDLEPILKKLSNLQVQFSPTQIVHPIDEEDSYSRPGFRSLSVQTAKVSYTCLPVKETTINLPTPVASTSKGPVRKSFVSGRRSTLSKFSKNSKNK